MTQYKSPLISCIHCRKVFSAKGIFTHFISTHTDSGREKCRLTGKQNSISKNSIIAQRKSSEKREVRKKLYETNPNKCKHCTKPLEYDHHRDKFCSQSCSCTFNSLLRGEKSRAALRKKCAVCDNMTLGKYCSTKCMGEGMIKYSTEEDRRHARKMMQRESNARYRAKQKYQTPCDEDLSAIKSFYKHCPAGHEVDHVVPISKGGLHSITNMQYLTITENRKKSAKIDWCPGGESNARHHS